MIHPAVPSTVYIPTTQNPSKTKKKKVGSTNSIGQHLKVTRIRAKKKVRSKQQTGKHLVIREREILHKRYTYVTYMYIVHADQEKIGEKKKERKSG